MPTDMYIYTYILYIYIDTYLDLYIYTCGNMPTHAPQRLLLPWKDNKVFNLLTIAFAQPGTAINLNQSLVPAPLK